MNTLPRSNDIYACEPTSPQDDRILKKKLKIVVRKNFSPVKKRVLSMASAEDVLFGNNFDAYSDETSPTCNDNFESESHLSGRSVTPTFIQS